MISKNQSKPVIGITLDHEQAGGYAQTPWYALRENYCESLATVGAEVIVLPHQPASISRYLELCDGILVSGGGFDIDPLLFGQLNKHASVQTKPDRTHFEKKLIEQALEKDKPILGICGGQQLLAVLLGASLHQHIPDDIPEALEHSPSGNVKAPTGSKIAHPINIIEGTLLHEITQTTKGDVNSSHHQAVVNGPGEFGLVINAVAPDGVVEGVEHPDYRFCLGVQWHPEFMLSELDERILRAFVEASAT